MPAYEVMHQLTKLGIPCAVGQSWIGDLTITCLNSGKTYEGFAMTTIERCIRRELGVSVGIELEQFKRAA